VIGLTVACEDLRQASRVGGSEARAALRQSPKIDSVVVGPSSIKCNECSQAVAAVMRMSPTITVFLCLKPAFAKMKKCGHPCLEELGSLQGASRVYISLKVPTGRR
jgi:hypothetical protein